MKRRRLLVALGLVVGIILSAPPVFAQMPTQTQIIPPGGKVDFLIRMCAGPAPPCFPLGFTVQSRADQPVTASFTEQTLSLAAPAGYVVQIVSGCVANDGPATVVHCTVGGLSSPPTVTVVFTTTKATTQTESIALFSGCNNVSLTWPDRTPISQVAAAVSPAPALVAIWHFDNSTQAFRGFSALPNAPNDLTTVNRMDAVFICMGAPGTLARPVI